YAPWGGGGCFSGEWWFTDAADEREDPNSYCSYVAMVWRCACVVDLYDDNGPTLGGHCVHKHIHGEACPNVAIDDANTSCLDPKANCIEFTVTASPDVPAGTAVPEIDSQNGTMNSGASTKGETPARRQYFMCACVPGYVHVNGGC
ncbi:hypothetical protein MAR_010968, partial [Mya arenaria]